MKNDRSVQHVSQICCANPGGVLDNCKSYLFYTLTRKPSDFEVVLNKYYKS